MIGKHRQHLLRNLARAPFRRATCAFPECPRAAIQSGFCAAHLASVPRAFVRALAETERRLGADSKAFRAALDASLAAAIRVNAKRTAK